MYQSTIEDYVTAKERLESFKKLTLLDKFINFMRSSMEDREK